LIEWRREKEKIFLLTEWCSRRIVFAMKVSMHNRSEASSAGVAEREQKEVRREIECQRHTALSFIRFTTARIRATLSS
jgi:hypothetical protein